MGGLYNEDGTVMEAVEECGELLSNLNEEMEADAEESTPSEVTETLGCMLPQIPLSEAVVDFILNPDYEYNDYVEEGVIQGVKNFGTKLKVSTNLKALSMKIAITKKRIEIAQKKKQFQDKIPALRKELAGYQKEFRRLESMASNEERRDINKVKKETDNSVRNNKEIKEACDEIKEENELLELKESADAVLGGLLAGAAVVGLGALVIHEIKDDMLTNRAIEYYAKKRNLKPDFSDLTKKVHKIDKYGEPVSDKEVKLDKDRRFNVIEIYYYNGKPWFSITFQKSTTPSGFGYSTRGDISLHFKVSTKATWRVYEKAAKEHINYYIYKSLKKHGMTNSSTDYKRWLGSVRTEYKKEGGGVNAGGEIVDAATESVYVDEMGQPIPADTRINFLQTYINQKLNPQLAQLKASLNGKTYAPDIQKIKQQIKDKEAEINAKKTEILTIKQRAGNIKKPGDPNRANTDPMRGKGLAIAASADDVDITSGDEVTEAKDMEPEIKPIVDKLNSLGYQVKYASPGHKKLRKKEDKQKDGVYYGALYTDARVMFKEDYKFPSAPKGWKWRTVDKCDYLDVIPKKCKADDGTEAFNSWKSEYMGNLKSWAFALPPKGSSPVTKANDNTNENRKKKSEAPNIIKHESVEFNRGEIRMMGDIYKKNHKEEAVTEEVVEESVENEINIEGAGFTADVDIDGYVNGFYEDNFSK